MHLWDIRAGKSVGGFVGPKIAGKQTERQHKKRNCRFKVCENVFFAAFLLGDSIDC